MADLLTTGISGLMAARVALDTTSNNIANVDTPGYSRESVELEANTPQSEGGYSIGSGVDVTGVQRAYSQYLTTSARDQNASLQRATTFNTEVSNLNNLFAGDANLQTALDGFYNSVQDAANDPTSVPVRQALLGNASSLVSTFHTLDSQLGLQWSQVNQQIEGDVSDINSLATNVANLNHQITAAYGAGTVPNNLLDQRDEALQKLSSDVGITTSIEGDNINVSVGTGQVLVEGSEVHELNAVGSPYDPSMTEVTTSVGTDITGELSGGDLGGLVDFRNSVLAPSRDQLGEAAVAFTSAVNAQSQKGMDLNGDLGGDLFTVPSPEVLPADGNSGSESVNASITDPGGLTDNNYILRYSGATWSAATASGAPVSVSGLGTAGDPLTFGGLSLVVAGAPVNGDSFLVQPTRAAAGGIQLAVSDPTKLALASPVQVTTGSANTATASNLVVTDPTNAALLATVQIAFTTPNTYTVNGSGSFTYTGVPIQMNGWSLTLNGSPASGDSFSVTSNAGGTGDNSNALAIGTTADLGVLSGGTVSAGAAYATLVADDGTVGAQAQTELSAETSLSQQATQAEQSVSGVNLDEEAANLVLYQQSYQASAQVIATANTIFNSLLSAIQ